MEHVGVSTPFLPFLADLSFGFLLADLLLGLHSPTAWADLSFAPRPYLADLLFSFPLRFPPSCFALVFAPVSEGDAPKIEEVDEETETEEKTKKNNE